MCICQHTNSNRSIYNLLTQQAIQQLSNNYQNTIEQHESLKKIQNLQIDYPLNKATSIFKNGNIYTMDQKKINPQAVAIRFNKIIKVGNVSQMESVICSQTQIIDLQGKTMLPGFIDPHIHTLFCTFKKWLDLGAYIHESRQDAKKSLIKAIQKHTQTDTLLTCWLYDPLITPGQFDVSIKGLDKLSQTVGIYILESNAHLVHVNTKAFKMMGIDKYTKDPPHGSFGRDQFGELTGEVNQSAVDVFRSKFPKVSAQQYQQYLLQLFQDAASLGCTALNDSAIGYIDPKAQLTALYGTMNKHSIVRITGMLLPARAQYWKKINISPQFTDTKLKIKAMKFYADGSVQLGTGYLRQKYINKQFNYGKPNYTKQQLCQQVKNADKQGWQVAIHANGDAAIDMVLDAYQNVYHKNDKRNLRHRIQHCTIAHIDQYQRMKRINVTPTFLIGHVYYFGEAFQQKVGKQLAMRLDCVKTAFDLNLKPSIHSDFCCQPIGPLRCIHNAVTRKIRNTNKILNVSQCITPYQGIQAMTINGAYILHLDEVTGSIEENKLADFVILNQNPLAIDPQNIINIKVLQTWMDGKITYNGWQKNKSNKKDQTNHGNKFVRSKL